MAIALRAMGTATAGSTGPSFNINVPAAQLTGDMMIAWFTGKPFNLAGTISDGTWTALGAGAASGSTGAGIDTGSMWIQAWYKEATSDTEAALTVTEGTPNWNVAMAQMCVFSKGASETWDTPQIAFGGDESSGTGISVTVGSDPGGAAGDYALQVIGINTDAMGPLTAALTSTWTGITFGTYDTASDVESTAGGDMAMHARSVPISSGTSSAAPVMAGTGTASGGADRLVGMFVRLRVTTVSNITFDAGMIPIGF